MRLLSVVVPVKDERENVGPMVERVRDALRETAFSHPESYFRRYADLDDDAAIDQAERIWDAINAPNLEQNILPTRGRATLVLRKGSDHSVERVRLRKL